MTIYKGQIPIAGLTSPIAPTKSMGQIVESKIPLVDAGLHLLDGTLVRGDGVYKVFVDRMADLYTLDPTAEYFCTQEEWEDSVFNYGVCEKFVYDSTNNTVRLPKMYSNIRYLIKSYSEGANWYRIYSDGWCEQGGTTSDNTGLVTVSLLKEYKNTNYSVYLTVNDTNASSGGSNYSAFTASSSFTTSSFKISKYADARQVNWQAKGYVDISDYKKSPNYLYIVLATASKNQEDLDVDMVMTELNGKVNVSDLISAHVVVEAYSNGTSWYRLYDDGWCEQGGTVTVSSNVWATVTFLKPYIDTNYCLAGGSKVLDSSYPSNPQSVSFKDYTLTTFQTAVNDDTTINKGTWTWRACGYADLSS